MNFANEYLEMRMFYDEHVYRSGIFKFLFRFVKYLINQALIVMTF